MSHRATSAHAGPVDEEHLAGLAAVLEAGVPLAAGDPAQLVRLRAAPADGLRADELELGLHPIEGGHPLDDLVGFTAPDDWAAIGVVGTGRATAVDGSASAPFRVRTVQLVARSGAWACRWAPLEDTDVTGGHADAGPTASADGGAASGPVCDIPAGRIDDALRRALGVATAPPPGDTQRLWATQWLDALVAAAADSPTRRRRLRPLAALVGLHPVIGAFDLDPAALDVTGLVFEADRLVAWRDWPQLRRACAGGLWSSSEVDPATAAWLDDGAFARWVLAGWPELADLREALEVLLAPSALSVIDDALAGWGLCPLEQH